MYQIEGYEWAIYGLSVFSVIMLGQLLFLKPKPKFKSAFPIGKIVCLVIFVITSMYWIITFPSVGWTYNFSDNKNTYSKDTGTENIKNDVDKNQKRIEILERELEQTQNDLEKVAGRIRLFLQIAMFGLIYFGVGIGVKAIREDKTDNNDGMNL